MTVAAHSASRSCEAKWEMLIVLRIRDLAVAISLKANWVLGCSLHQLSTLLYTFHTGYEVKVQLETLQSQRLGRVEVSVARG